MMGTSGTAILRRIVGPPLAASAPLTPARALRLAMTRAAERTVALALSVLDVVEEEGFLDDLLAGLEGGLMLVSLVHGPAGGPRGGPVGLMGLDAEARAAVIEAQTLGRPSDRPAAPRAVTSADLAIACPLVEAFLLDADGSLAGTRLAGWVGPARPGSGLAGTREAAMLLPDGAYRIVRLTLDIGVGGRHGLVVMMIRLAEPPEEPAATPGAAWPDLLSAQVMQAQAPIEAVLHRMRLPLGLVEALMEGQVLPLPGAGLGSVRIEGPGGRDLGAARLGQVGGMRAVRIEGPRPPVLADLPPPRRDGA